VNVGVLLITHGDVGSVLLQTAIDVLSVCPLSTCVLSAPAGCDPEKIYTEALRAADDLDSGDGVLVLTDLYGSTPSNIACRLHKLSHIRVVSGLNLPMLIRVLNYPDLDLDELAHKAITGGRDGVLTCSTEGSTAHAG
jgi:PTS system ascorbate-specific IIA component